MLKSIIRGGGVLMKQLTDEKFELLISEYYNELARIAYNYVRDSFYADDAVHDAFVKYYRAHKTFESDEHIKSWLIRVTINNCLDILKRKNKELLINTEYINNLPDTSEADNKKNEDIYECICSLKDSYKTILFLYYYDNYSLKDIANILKISESNASTRLVRARSKLRIKVLERRKTNEQ